MPRQMKLTKSALEIDAPAWCSRIEGFIKARMSELYRDGIVVTVSGGLDSSIAATLCVRAVGRERVRGLMLPESWQNPEADRYGRMIADHLGIGVKKVNISPILRGLGTSSPFLTLMAGRESWKRSALMKKLLKGDTRLDILLKELKGQQSPRERRTSARIYSKHRTRVLVVYRYAEENNLLVVGAAHKSEDMLGLFSKYGIDDCADLMPMKNLYRSHILQLGEYMGVPREILGRAPNPDIIPGVTDKYRDYFNLDSLQVDLVLLGLEGKMPAADIARQLGIRPESVSEIAEVVALSAHKRNPAMAPTFDA